MIDFLMEVFKKNRDGDFMVWGGKEYTYEYLLGKIIYWGGRIEEEGIKRGTVVILKGDFSPNSVALFLALIDRKCVIVPITYAVKPKWQDFIQMAQGEVSFFIDKDDHAIISKLHYSADHPLYKEIRELGHPGLVLFSSGSTGKSKGVVHDMSSLLEKFKTPRNRFRTIIFLLYDHIGGINTLLYSLSNAGCIITLQDRSPDSVLEAVEKYKAELLPVSPTFLNLVLLSEAYKRHDLSSLKIVSYGTEPMPEGTLKRFTGLYPHITMVQTYGLSELGILHSKSKSSDSLWVKIGGEGFETRVVEGILQIKAKSAMLGYLNAPSPFTEDGWFITGDCVEVEGDYLKILGRESEIINVGGQKVYPAEVENALQDMDNVEEVMVFGEKNIIMGNIICANVKLIKPEDAQSFSKRMRKFCSKKIEDFKIPIKVQVVEHSQHTERFKKRRVAE